ncbi:hypothetical protein MKX01_019585 [Papaver californicum]|nr:hypothetical protein MKX01_019585 [Papaver californicum]
MRVLLLSARLFMEGIYYKRQIFLTPDGGTIALDWLMSSAVSGGASHTNNVPLKDDITPIVVVVPGLTSDSHSAYIKHLVFKIVKSGWNVVVSNHRGLGGISITSDCFYNAGWTDDLRRVVDHLHQDYPQATLFAVGTSIGSNVLVKYLGEEGDNTYFAGAVAICSPWDLLMGDRFITRKLVQRLYDRVLTIGLQGYAKLHQTMYSRLADWEGIQKSRRVRDFDNYATCLTGPFETVDTYYRRSSSSTFVGNASVLQMIQSVQGKPFLGMNAGQTKILNNCKSPMCRWVKAVDEFLSVLYTSPYMHIRKKVQNPIQHSPLETSIDQGPYVTVTEEGMVSAVGNEPTSPIVNESDNQETAERETRNIVVDTHESEREDETKTDPICETSDPCKQDMPSNHDAKLLDISAPLKRCIQQLSRRSKTSMWLLAYIAVMTTWPMLGPDIFLLFKRKLKSVLPSAWLKK